MPVLQIYVLQLKAAGAFLGGSFVGRSAFARSPSQLSITHLSLEVFVPKVVLFNLYIRKILSYYMFHHNVHRQGRLI